MNSRKTGIICSVRGCHNNWYKRKRFLEQVCFDHKPRTRAECGCEAPYNLHPPPCNERARQLWLKALNLEKAPKRPYVCSFHFVDRRPTKEHPYPEKWLGYDAPPDSPTQCADKKISTDETPRSADFVASSSAHTSAEQPQRNTDNPQKSCELTLALKRKRTCDEDETPTLSTEESNATSLEQEQSAEHIYMANLHSLQTITPCTSKVCQATVKTLTAECAALRAEITRLKEKVHSLSFTQETFRNNDELVQELTGLASYTKFMIVFSLVSKFLKAGSGLTNFQCFLITVMRMRLNLPVGFFSHVFGVSQSTVAEVFNATLGVMYERLSFRLIVWPGKEQIRINLPKCFRATFNDCTSIINRLEMFIEKPKSMTANDQWFSQYRNHDTVKYLISITPQGVVSFVSKGLGGLTSDKSLTERCGYLDKLSPGDVILTGKGFNIKDVVGLHPSDLNIQAFIKTDQQLQPLKLDETSGLVAVQSHVERVINLIRNKYMILQSTVPVSLCNTTDEGQTSTLDKMVTVCCALCNISPSVVPTD
ncbi:hypothetical protein KOW79_008949 [Hemibagrus wyckioides]|uniref:THAP-type domain-containing protein n=1 Tax=Hemibagrus wyckioides TaxID=337641 RepID=A0A9D3NU66_9TELE|nr:uncharacterized protein si:dkey-56d12.4 isoform X2 [Hemibagrus wyckioides]KAG7327343.1 hypothetical protein KOW79_008949 [Hemibagrus wyckioides]